VVCFFFQAEDGIRDRTVTGVQTCALPISIERRFQRLQAEALLDAGVTLADPARIDVRGTLACGRDVAIDPGCLFEGAVSLADDEIGRASCRERVKSAGVGVDLKEERDGAR